MSMSWYPTLVAPADPTIGLAETRIESAFEIGVDDPGYGYLWLRVLAADEFLGIEDEGYEVTLAGGELGAWVSELTTRAVCADDTYEISFQNPIARRRGDLPSWVTSTVARCLLPAFNAAVLLAAAGTDRYERIRVEDELTAIPPICVRCGEGSDWSDHDSTSAWCDKHGHTAFGMVHIHDTSAYPLSLDEARRHHLYAVELRQRPASGRESLR